VSQEVVSELAPTGVLRAAINMGNFLLVTGKAPAFDGTDVWPVRSDLYVTFRKPIAGDDASHVAQKKGLPDG
jgi:hypothetical protein